MADYFSDSRCPGRARPPESGRRAISLRLHATELRFRNCSVIAGNRVSTVAARGEGPSTTHSSLKLVLGLGRTGRSNQWVRLLLQTNRHHQSVFQNQSCCTRYCRKAHPASALHALLGRTECSCRADPSIPENYKRRCSTT